MISISFLLDTMKDQVREEDKEVTNFFLSMSGISLLSAFSTITCPKREIKYHNHIKGKKDNVSNA